MNIACIAWGSLIWKAGPLPLASAWKTDGPRLPIEFARTSDTGELAIVLCDDVPDMPTYWACLDVTDVNVARELLRQREQASPQNPESIARLPKPVNVNAKATPHDERISSWMRQHGIDACVWTALPPRSNDEEHRKPTVDEAVDYLDKLTGKTRAHAEDYVRRVPPEINTSYRRAIEDQLGWFAYKPGDTQMTGR